MDKYSKVYKWKDAPINLKFLPEEFRKFDAETVYKQKRISDDMFQDLFMLKDLPPNIIDPIADFIKTIHIDFEEHSGGVETVRANQKVVLHADFGTGFSWKFTRKCNVMFNLEESPIHIIHDNPKYNKDILPGEMMVLNVTKQHGADHRHINHDCHLLTLNLRMDYFDTVKYFDNLLVI